MTDGASLSLPSVRGTYTPDAPLKDITWFRVGGPAATLFRPADVADLAAFLGACAGHVPVSVIGVGSNLLVRDGGIPGVVVRLPAAFGRIEIQGNRVRAGAAALDASVARASADAGIAGLAFLRGVPGTIGGALRMNAGCYGHEIKDIFVEAVAVDGGGRRHTLTPADMGFAYRRSAIPDDFIFVEALFEGTPGEPKAIHARMEELVAAREASQPIRAKTGGSTFKNPPGHKAWALVADAGCRGLVRGGAQVSEKHANFLINTGQASAADLEGLGEDIRARVAQRFGVTLEWEIRRVGVAP